MEVFPPKMATKGRNLCKGWISQFPTRKWTEIHRSDEKISLTCFKYIRKYDTT